MGKSAERAGTVRLAIDVGPAVDEHLRTESLVDEFAVAARTAEEFFPDARHIRVTLEYDPEEQGVPPTVAFRVATALSRVAFDDACSRFHTKLWDLECSRLLARLAVVGDR